MKNGEIKFPELKKSDARFFFPIKKKQGKSQIKIQTMAKWLGVVKQHLLCTRIDQSCAIAVDINSTEASCDVFLVFNQGASVVRANFEQLGGENGKEITENVNACLLILKHQVMRGNIRASVQENLNLIKLERPFELPMKLYYGTATDKYNVLFPMCSPLQLSLLQVVQLLRAVSFWMVGYCLAEEEEHFCSVPRALKPLMTHFTAMVSSGLLPDRYPGYCTLAFFSDIRLFLRADIEHDDGHDTYPLFCDFFENDHDPSSSCSSIGCTNVGPNVTDSICMCVRHAKENLLGRSTTGFFSPKAFICRKETGTWRARCPSAIQQAINLGQAVFISRCECGVPYVYASHTTKDSRVITPPKCESCSGRRERALQAFRVMTGGLRPVDIGTTGNFEDEELLHRTMLQVTVSEAHVTYDRFGSTNMDNIKYLHTVVDLLEIDSSPILKLSQLQYHSERSLVYTLHGRDINDIQNTPQGTRIVTLLFEEFERHYNSQDSNQADQNTTMTVREMVIKLGAAGFRAGKSEKIKKEHSELSRLCAASSLTATELIREPLALCMEDACIRLAQVSEAIRESLTVGVDLISTAPASTNSMATIAASGADTCGSVLSFFDVGWKAQFPIDTMVPLDIQNERSRIQACERDNRERAKMSHMFDTSTVTSAVQRAQSDITFIEELVFRIRCLRLAWKLAQEDRYGLRHGRVPALTELRELVESLGLLSLARDGPIDKLDMAARLHARHMVLTKRARCANISRQVTVAAPKLPVFTSDSLHRLVYNIAGRSIAYCPQDLLRPMDHIIFPGLASIRGPFRWELDLVDYARAISFNLHPCWVLELTVTPFPLWGGLYWQKKQHNIHVTVDELLLSRKLMMSRALDPRVYTPFGPNMAAAAGSFLLRVVRSMLSREDMLLKHHMSSVFDKYLCGNSVKDFNLAEYCLPIDTSMTANTRLVSLHDVPSLCGQRVPSSELMASPEAQFLCLTDRSDSTCKAPPAEYFEMFDLPSIEKIMSASIYRPGHLCAVPDICRAMFGCHSQDKLVKVYSNYGVSIMGKSSFGACVTELSHRIDTSLRFDFLYSNIGKSTAHPEIYWTTPGLRLIGKSPQFASPTWSPDGLVYLCNYRGFSMFDTAASSELLLDIISVSRACVARAWRLSSSEVLFMLETGLFKITKNIDEHAAIFKRVRECIILMRGSILNIRGRPMVYKTGIATNVAKKHTICVADSASSFYHHVDDLCDLATVLCAH